jgi:ATP-dependent DNA helicase RecG
MEKLRLRPPEIEERENSVVVHIRHAPLASTHDVIMSYLETHSEITNSIVRELTGIGSENVVKQAFIDLKNRKMIEPVPGKKGSASAWRKYSAVETSSDEENSTDSEAS